MVVRMAPPMVVSLEMTLVDSWEVHLAAKREKHSADSMDAHWELHSAETWVGTKADMSARQKVAKKGDCSVAE